MKAIIVAVDSAWGIGKDGVIPWYYPEDFAWFKKQTKDTVCIMGKTTFEEIAEKFKFKETGKFLPGRRCYVVSKSLSSDDERDALKSRITPDKNKENISIVTFVPSITSALTDCSALHPDKNIFFIGGTKIFEEALTLVDEVYLTNIPGEHDCNVLFPHRKMAEEKFDLYHEFVENNTVNTGDKPRFFLFKRTTETPKNFTWENITEPKNEV